MRHDQLHVARDVISYRKAFNTSNDRFNERAILLHAATEIIATDSVRVLTSIQKERLFIHVY